MRTQAMTGIERLGVQPLDDDAMVRIEGGVPWAATAYVVGAYLAKTVGDHWGDFKKGVKEGFRKVWNT